jgi:hypothetical protein
MTALFLCDLTGNMARPWAEAGYECVCVDVQHSIRRDREAGGIRFVWGDIRSWWDDDVIRNAAFVAAFPPCTHLAVSGARDFEKKGLGLLIEALEIVEACRRICVASGAPWMIENPVSRLSSIWRKPDYTFHPWEYAGWNEADNYTKLTCIWSGGGFVMPPKRPGIHEPDDRIWKTPPSADRANIRSATPMGFSRAVFEANSRVSKAA